MFEKLLRWLRSMLSQMFAQGADADIVLSDKMTSAIAMWARMYEDGGAWCNPKSGIHSLRLAAAIASEIARLVTIEMGVSVTGSARADFLQAQLAPFLDGLRRHVEVGCALGGEVFKPYVDDGRVCIDAVQGDCFFPTTVDTSGRMLGAIFVAQIKRRDTIYTRAEHHEFQSGTHTIENRAFASKSSYSFGTPIDLTAVPEWADIQPQVTIEHVDRPLFAYFRIPRANKQDRQSPLGVSVYADAMETIRDADEQYGRMLWEYEGGQLAVEMEESLLKHGPNGSVSSPRLEERLYRRRAGDIDAGNNFYQIFAPTLRDDAYARGLNTILKKIEYQSGLAYGTLSDPIETDKTATEINASKQRSYSTVRDIQKALQSALDDLLYSMDALATLYNLAPAGSYTAAYDWDDSIVNDPSQRKSMFWSYVMAGKYPMWRYLVEFEGYTEDEAREIADETQADFNNPFGFTQPAAGGGGNADA
ncbi:phage portal protein [Ethanoligenens harbinense]|uniref:Uncharacterized protein n=1 Tax=Ethanoligenens harbinense (strain DSM 18485 / JCM 12961 / CGMCC 1.5033 / YUAN-3) TaxID=663278 RepID=E6U601_ETHHY|nr:phage portal protein [Ethanoligenens harbinense]ADU25680.1 hypothetical protein Ethha_0090 [Ethanoligenens harbinense YUAN-3]AVQ97291.1 capsid protein [Ethanoligenens harbinense YUAN-3]AYF39957.1 capsid protein [Ethanoligenens harbinense]AYF42785.1 capsid protein [Ethanoligenens harbinense]QCN93536.1 capsid protein [Ethanoligenens harbinense]